MTQHVSYWSQRVDVTQWLWWSSSRALNSIKPVLDPYTASISGLLHIKIAQIVVHYSSAEQFIMAAVRTAVAVTIVTVQTH